MFFMLFVTEEVIWRIKLSQNMHGYTTGSPASPSGTAGRAKYANAHKKRHLLERWLARQERIWGLNSDFSNSLFWRLSSETKPQSSRVLKVASGFKTSHDRSPRKSQSKFCVVKATQRVKCLGLACSPSFRLFPRRVTLLVDDEFHARSPTEGNEGLLVTFVWRTVQRLLLFLELSTGWLIER